MSLPLIRELASVGFVCGASRVPGCIMALPKEGRCLDCDPFAPTLVWDTPLGLSAGNGLDQTGL